MPLGLNLREFIELARRYEGDPAGFMAATPQANWRPSRGGLSSIPLFGSRGGQMAVNYGARTWAGGGVSLGALQPGTTPAPVLPGAGEFGPTTPSFCNLITNQALRAACLAGTAIFGGGSGGNGTAGILPAPQTCPPGYRPSSNGGCQLEGLAPYIPGDIGRADYVWTPVNGRYGAGLTPVSVQSARMYCPAGYKLGKDNVCYECLGKTQRKWNPGTRPMFTGGDMNALRRAQRLQKKARGIQKLFPAAKVCRTTRGKRK